MANKKINQLVLKTTIQSTDLFPLGDATTGQLYKKTIAELQAAIGGAVISVNGLVGTVVLDTDDIQELASPTNKYFTDARARAAISLTVTGSSGASTYSSSTGVLNVPTYTLAGLGGITASFLSGGTGITYNSSTGVIATTITQYTDALARAALSGTAPITYNSTTGAIGITQATTSTDGYLSSTDWNTFNGKQSTLTLGNFTEATSSVLTITGGTGAIVGSGLSVQVKQATTSVSGFLSSTDWNTFNNKQNTITNPVTGTGTAGYHAKWTSGSAIGNGIIYDDGNQIGINITPPTWYSNFKGLNLPNGSLIGYSTNASIFLNQNLYFNAAGSWTFVNSGTGGQYSIDGTANHTFSTVASGSAGAAATLVERMRINSSGNVGIGVSPGSWYSTYKAIQLKDATSMAIWSGGYDANITSNAIATTLGGAVYGGAAAGAAKYTQYDGGHYWYSASAGSAGSAISFTERMRITSGGNVGIGASTSPTYLLEVSTAGGSQRIRVGTLQNNNNSATFEAITTANNTTASAAFFRANAGGSASIGVTTYNKSGGDSGNFANLSSQANTISIQLTPGGNSLFGTETDNGERVYVSGSIRATGSITANSDARLKKNIERIENALEKVGQISGYTYNTIYDEDRHAGVIAQEIDKVLPEIVNKGNDGLMGVEYGNISALLIEAIKDLKKDNESLRAIVEGLRK